MAAKFSRFSDRVNELLAKQGGKSLNRWMDNQEVCRQLNISPRTLQTLRDNGTLAYSQINHKVFYRPEDVWMCRALSSPLNVSWQTKPFDYYCTTKSNVTMSEMITKNHALIAEFGDSLDRLLDGIENFMANSRPTLGGERFLTDREVSARLKVSRRTLQDYRNNGIIAYYQLGGKILYKESDIESMLAANYREAFR